MGSRSVRRHRHIAKWLGSGFAGALAVGAVTIFTAGTAIAQDAELVDRGKRLFDGKANCAECHSWKADGKPSNRSGGGADLHITGLDREGLIETIQCGRPDTLMPYHDKQAYKDDRCFGMTSADIGKSKPDRGKKTLTEGEMGAIVEFLLAKVVGKPLDLEYCEYYHGVGATTCNRFRTN